jgi:hypothetical protein
MYLERIGATGALPNVQPSKSQRLGVAPTGARRASVGWVLLAVFVIGSVTALSAAIVREAPPAQPEIVSAIPSPFVPATETPTVLCDDPHPTCIPAH